MREKIYSLFLLFVASVFIISCSKQAAGSHDNNNGGDTTRTDPGSDTLGHSIVMYGTTATGGDNDAGTIFKINGDGTEFKTVYSFKSSEGNTPLATLCKAPNGKLYGAASGGGIYSQGTLFSFDPSTNTVKKIIDFNVIVNGMSDPVDLTLARNGILYGGSGLYFFSVDPATDKFTLLHKSDVYTEGNISNCTPGNGGKLYGISHTGGARVSPGDTSGIIYSYDIQKNIFKRLYTFTRPAGMSPVNKLCAGADGNLYGLTHEGGTNNVGVIFRYNPSTGVYTRLVDLDGSKGKSPVLRNHLEEWNSLLYGVAFLGDTYAGCLFSYNTVTNTQTVLYKPQGPDPASILDGPVGFLITGQGLMYINGINTTASIMRHDPVTNTNKIIFHFPDAKTTVFSGLVQY